ncbi:uncharacterized protein LOC128243468 [Mya arenaria]|uniref:uncharacterized protein LOC128243468 n=1 Tax=Mya arenaria TaxID=6604 RepID=UPI0022E339DE|nr:uncharacterized protein LOC128243468 [Mya arenaria]
MARTHVYFCALFISTFSSVVLALEPVCPVCSKYDYEEKLLERVIRMEFTVEKIVKDNKAAVSDQINEGLDIVRRENAQLRELISEMSTNHTDYERQQSNKVEESLSSARASLDDAIQLTKAKETPFVLFHASNPKDRSPATGDTIVFSDIQTNEGLGYDDVTGKFTAPVSGLYMFFMQVCVQNSVYVNLQLVKEANVLIGSSYFHTQGYPCSSAQVVTRLVESESVWVYCVLGRGSAQLYHDTNVRWTSFGGALVHK